MTRIIAFLFFFVSLTGISAEIPVANFVKHGDYLNMELSPDGKHIQHVSAMKDGFFWFF